ncbi:MAG: DUF4294 domain-containing protein [Prolixibacteraceae bacterium]|nr:DUF4294 domain-containing protein [Prolixibacteraceae bacterium]MBT6006089.1 DUF4294 domain-containing protein [Prolixibacteraceae bacterium]MBT6766314.1 DUF4294 domain-containing protein [Prolixibacteraceae bacterium]MBT6999838.1 DUF4294 domain-containing protein [Prolixibacteraceae bacterium]MBT7394289.1 DUF4294 domain-containing protein [Prolixibacteraceae bacterium]
MKKVIFILVFVVPFIFELKSQERDTSDFTLGFIEGGDTIIYKNLNEIWVFPRKDFKNRRQEKRYSRYINKVKKVYPLAVEARKLLEKYEPEYSALVEQRDRRRLMKKLEKELLAEHKEKLKKWSISDGKILIKLIDRETKRTSYSLIKDFRGDVSAVFWQGIARIFKNNLKTEYDPTGEDRVLEEIVTLIEMGYL